MIAPTFPRVTIPGVVVSAEQRTLMDTVNEQHKAWRGLKVGMAMALVSNGQQPYVKPPANVIEKRRKAAKAARLARRASR